MPMTPQEAAQYAQQQAQAKYNQQKSQYDTTINHYQNLLNGLQSDQAIRQNAQNTMNNKYADVFAGINSQRNQAKTQYETQIGDMKKGYADYVAQIDQKLKDDRGYNLDNTAKRGLYNSSIMDQMNQIAQSERNKNESTANTNLWDNVKKASDATNALYGELDSKLYTSQKQMANDIENMFNSLVQDRNKQRSEYDYAIQQARGGIQSAYDNMWAEKDRMYQDLLNQYNSWQLEQQKLELQRQAQAQENAYRQAQLKAAQAAANPYSQPQAQAQPVAQPFQATPEQLQTIAQEQNKRTAQGNGQMFNLGSNIGSKVGGPAGGLVGGLLGTLANSLYRRGR